ncbi:hypothetical protein JCM10207_005170 [Rhodosporidiobolus poonsookiae]
MPSFKATLLAVAVAALTFTDVSAKTHNAGVARRNAAAAALSKRQFDKSGDYSKGTPFMSTVQALAAANVRCGTDAVCERRTAAAPANGAAVCISGRCSYRCDSGFAPGGADGTQCVASASACAGVTCDVPDNGYATCDATTGACVVGCNSGYTRYSQTDPPTAPYFCFAVASDAANCGTPGNVCPSSYNGIGSPSCKSGNCRITCPAGYFLRSAASSTNPFYCYNGSGSLVTDGPGSTA